MGVSHAAQHTARKSGAQGGEIRAHELVKYAAKTATKFGSSTLLVASLNEEGSHIGISSIGDSTLIVCRRKPDCPQWQVVLQSQQQHHSFNCPYQVCHKPTINQICSTVPHAVSLKTRERLQTFLDNAVCDSPERAHCASAQIEEGDFVLLGTDGVFDNFYVHEILAILAQSLSPIEAVSMGASHLATCPKKLARTIAQLASFRANDKRARCPFSDALWELHASHGGKLTGSLVKLDRNQSHPHTLSSHDANNAQPLFVGGKLDDISVVCAWAVG
eukprot:GHVR01005309.1.p1 GENE.GHVR01005309.1~~GHVR01005309.1.p1  ORF type:complete len:275 (-),score=57.57 GHVR01005309.1:235-1059(-)